MYSVIVYEGNRVIRSASFYDSSSAYRFFDKMESIYNGLYNIRFSARK